MATEHEIGGGAQRSLHMDQQFGGWGGSSSCRYNSSSSWRPWGNNDISSTAVDPDLSEDGRNNFAGESLEYGSAKASEWAEDNLGRVSDSAEDGWDEVPHSAKSLKASQDGWDEASYGAESPKVSWGKPRESAEDGWDDLYDPDCEMEESQEAEIIKKCSGLANLGNTCFMNSVLQCLTYTVPFANRILDSQHRLSCRVEEFCAMCAIENHIKVVLAASGRTVSPAFLAHNLDQISRSFIPGQQQDAHEFLFFLLEGMQQHCKSSGSCLIQGPDTDLMTNMFMGQMKSQVKCKSCSHCSDSVEPFLGLNLEIENCDSVKEALSNYVALEDLQEEDKISCSHCKQASSRSKQLSFSKPPQVLIVQLKRYKASEFFPTKIERDIKYTMSLDLTPFVSRNDAAPVQELDWHYNLYAVLVHSGWSTSSGHYYCYVQTSPNVWHCMNDSLVSRASKWTVLHQEAYILFYIRKGMEEELHLENVLSANQDLDFSEGPQPQALDSVRDDPYLCYSPDRDDSALHKRSLLDCDLKESVVSQVRSLKPEVSSHQDQEDIEVEPRVVCTRAKSPVISNQVVTEKELGTNSAIATEKELVTNSAIAAQQASKVSHSSSKGRILHDLDEPKCSPCLKRGAHELEEPKHSLSVKTQSSQKAEGVSSLPSPAGRNQMVLDSFENGSQYSYVRLLNRMPSSRRHALLASALSGQEATKQSKSPKATSAKDKSKPAYASKQTHLLQAGMGRATSNLLQKAEQQEFKGSFRSREKPCAEDHEYLNSRKLQRVGGKRVMANFRSSGVHEQVLGEGKANIV